MIRLLYTAMFAAALLIALAGCGSDNGGTNPTPAGFTRLVAAHHQNPGLASVDSPVWDSIPAGRINIGADSAYNAGLSPATGITADLKALVSGDSLFIRATWIDASASNLYGRLHALDENGDLTWEQDTIIYNEDRFYVVFDENGTGCKRFCHSVANANGRKFYGGASDEADIWHWKAHRTGMALFTTPATLGFAEDMHITDTTVAPDPQASDNDNLYFNNLNSAGWPPTPRKMHTTGSAFTGPGLVEGAWVTYNASQHWIDSTVNPPAGRFLPGYYMQNLIHANGSRWDVRAMATHNGASWTVVFCRKLTTDDLDDVDLTSATPDSALINIAVGYNSGIRHYGYKPFYLVVQ